MPQETNLLPATLIQQITFCSEAKQRLNAAMCDDIWFTHRQTALETVSV